MLAGQSERMHQSRPGEQVQRNGIKRVAIAEEQRGKHGLPLRHEAGGVRSFLVPFLCGEAQRRRLTEAAHKGGSHLFAQSRAKIRAAFCPCGRGPSGARHDPGIEPYILCRPVCGDIVASFCGVDVSEGRNGTDTRGEDDVLAGERPRSAGQTGLIP